MNYSRRNIKPLETVSLILAFLSVLFSVINLKNSSHLTPVRVNIFVSVQIFCGVVMLVFLLLTVLKNAKGLSTGILLINAIGNVTETLLNELEKPKPTDFISPAIMVTVFLIALTYLNGLTKIKGIVRILTVIICVFASIGFFATVLANHSIWQTAYVFCSYSAIVLSTVACFIAYKNEESENESDK